MLGQNHPCNPLWELSVLLDLERKLLQNSTHP